MLEQGGFLSGAPKGRHLSEATRATRSGRAAVALCQDLNVRKERDLTIRKSNMLEVG